MKGLIVGDVGQLLAQIVDVGVVLVWGLGTGFILFGILKATMGLRAPEEDELAGLDVPEPWDRGVSCRHDGDDDLT